MDPKIACGRIGMKKEGNTVKRCIAASGMV